MVNIFKKIWNLTKEARQEDLKKNECTCCKYVLEYEGRDCICQEDQVIDLDNGESCTYRSRLECYDWNCSYCH